MKYFIPIICLLVVAFFNSCISSTRLESNQVKEVENKVEKVFVLIDNSQNLKFFEHLEEDIFLAMLSGGVPTYVFEKNLLSNVQKIRSTFKQ